MGYDRGDNFPFDFEPNGILFGSESKGILSPRSYPIQCERKFKYSFLSVAHLAFMSCMNANLLKIEVYFIELFSLYIRIKLLSLHSLVTMSLKLK